MGETNGIPGMPDGPPPGAPGSPEAPNTPPAAAPALPDFGPTKAPDAPPMTGISRAAMGLWIALVAVIVIAGIFVAAQVFRGFTGGPLGGDVCTFTHEPSEAELAACLDSGPESP